MAARTPDPDTTNTLVDSLADWLMSQALGETSMEETFEGCCVRLMAADIPASRCFVGFRTLHPLFHAVSLHWEPAGGLQTIGHRHDESRAVFERGPHHFMIERGLPALRRRLSGRGATLDFPILEELRAAGITDYFAYLVPFQRAGGATPSDGIIGSWATGRRTGFTEQDLRAFQRIQRRLAVACKVRIKEQIARTVLATYIGRDAGRRVLEGVIQRGDGEVIHSVIWFCDLRDSTRLAASLPGGEFLATLNDFFECTAGAVLDHGGEVLRFIGDALLAIFPISDHGSADAHRGPPHRTACETALESARDAMERVAKLNTSRAEEGKSPVRFGIGLHVGDVIYGNIGVPARLEFSVVGPAANEAARVESLCKVLGRPLLTSAEFAALLPDAAWESLGAHLLPGIGTPREIFTLAEFSEAAVAAG